MSFKMLISMASALAILGSMAVTVNAEGEPTLDSWKLNEASYTADFTGYSSTDTVDTSALATNGWSFADGSKRVTVRNGAISFEYERNMYLGKAAESGSYYYTYKINMWGNGGAVILYDTDKNVVATLVKDLTDKTATEYTTVVDAETKKAYTYQITSQRATVVGSTEISDLSAIKGIGFTRSGNENKSFWIYSVSYGTCEFIPLSYKSDQIETFTTAKGYDQDVTAATYNVTANRAVNGITVTQAEGKSVTINTTFAQGTPMTIGVIAAGDRDRNYMDNKERITITPID